MYASLFQTVGVPVDALGLRQKKTRVTFRYLESHIIIFCKSVQHRNGVLDFEAVAITLLNIPVPVAVHPCTLLIRHLYALVLLGMLEYVPIVFDGQSAIFSIQVML